LSSRSGSRSRSRAAGRSWPSARTAAVAALPGPEVELEDIVGEDAVGTQPATWPASKVSAPRPLSLAGAFLAPAEQRFAVEQLNPAVGGLLGRKLGKQRGTQHEGKTRESHNQPIYQRACPSTSTCRPGETTRCSRSGEAAYPGLAEHSRQQFGLPKNDQIKQWAAAGDDDHARSAQSELGQGCQVGGQIGFRVAVGLAAAAANRARQSAMEDSRAATTGTRTATRSDSPPRPSLPTRCGQPPPVRCQGARDIFRHLDGDLHETSCIHCATVFRLLNRGRGSGCQQVSTLTALFRKSGSNCRPKPARWGPGPCRFRCAVRRNPGVAFSGARQGYSMNGPMLGVALAKWSI